MTGSIYQAATEISVGERDGSVTVTFLRSGDLSGPVNVTYDVTSESTTPGVDFTGSSGTVRFAAGQDRVSVTFNVVNDTLSEATETFIVSIASLDSGTLGTPRTTRVNILDDENPVVPPVDPPLTTPYTVTTQPVVTGIGNVINFDFSPLNDDIIYIAQKDGQILCFNAETGQNLGTFIDLRTKVNDYSDRGLMDIAIHPDFANNPYIYAFYVVDAPGLADNSNGNRFAHVVRFTADSSQGYLRAIPGSEVILLGGAGTTTADINGGGLLDFTNPTYANQPSSERYVNPNDPTPAQVINGFKQDYIKVDSITHAGGALAFGPDGALYISTGDGGSPNYADPHALDVQNINSLSGKILRVNPLTGDGYANNPFYQAGASLDINQSKIFQLGLRNPFSMGFDDLGRLFITDTGWNAYEEVNVGPPGANFGWPYYEGGLGGTLAQTSGYRDLPSAPAFYQSVANGTIQVTAPYTAFAHAESAPGYSSQVITGGSVIYTGDKYPADFLDDYFFTNFTEGTIFSVDTNNRQDVKFLKSFPDALAPTHFLQGPDGYVYYADYGIPGGGGGGIGRLLISGGPGPSVSVSAQPIVLETAGAGVTVTFTLSAVQTAPVIVTYSTNNGTAIAGSDFNGAANATVTIPTGQTSATVTIPLINDSVYEPNEAFTVVLNGATRNGAPFNATGQATITITDNDPAPPGTNLLVNGSFETPTILTGQIAAYYTIPGWTAITGGTIEIWNNGHNGVSTSNGVNFLELDYDGVRDGFYQDVQTVAGQTYTLSFDQRLRPNQSAATCGVEVVWNGVVVATTAPTTQSFAAFNVNVTGTGALDRLTIREIDSQSSDGNGALIDNFRLTVVGPPLPSVSISASPTTISEASATGVTVTFTLSAVQTSPVTVTYSTANGTATAGADFTGSTNATVPIPTGQTTATVTIPLIDNTVFEPTETFNVVLNGATLNGSPITASGSTTISITDNEPAPPSVSISAAPTTLAEAAGAGVTVTFTLSAAQAAPTTVTYSTANGTATAGTDFTGATNATVTIPTGQTTATVTIPLINDSVFEPTETFSVVLNSAVSNGSPLSATGSATITITDNDAPPPNLLVNGSFESTTVAAGQYAAFTSITGWTAITGGTIELWNAHNGVTASNGTRFAELDYAGARDGFYQDVQTVAGQTYTLSFDQRLRPSQPASTSGVEVVWNGTVIATSTPSTQTFAAVNFTVTGTGALDRLTIREVSSQGGDGLGPLIDNFALVATGAPPPTVTVSATPATVAETAGANAVVTFTLSSAQAAPVIVTYSTGAGTATAGTDFTAATNATVTIPTGQTSVTVNIPIIDNALPEPSETFTVALNGATLNGSAITAIGTATFTITDADPALPTISVSAAPTTVSEASATGVTVTFTLSAASTAPVTVTYSTTNGTATAGADFTGATNATTTIAAGQTTATVTIPMINNTVLEPSETFNVVLNGATLQGAALTATGPTTIPVTITDDEVAAPTISISATPASFAEAAGGNAVVTFTLSAAATSPVTVTYSTQNGTATAGSDFTGATNVTVTIPTGQTSTTATIPLIDNALPEASETFSVVLNSATMNGAPLTTTGSTTQTLTITDADPALPTISVSAAPTTISEASATGVTVTFTLSAASTAPVTVTYSTTNGTATAGADFTGATNVQVTIPAGQTSTTATIPMVNNTVFEPSETFNVVLNSATLEGAALTTTGPTTIPVTITDDEAAPPTISVAVDPATLSESNGVDPGFAVIFTLSAAATSPVTVTYSTQNGTATAGSDFVGATNATIVIPTGQTGATVYVPLIDNTVFEPSETFNVVLNSATQNGAPLTTTGATTIPVSITDDDPAPPTISIAATPATVAEAAGESAVVTFTLSAAATAPVTVTYSTQNDTATAGSDFTGATSATVTIPTGQTSVTASIPLIDNSLPEASETFSVVLSGATMNGAPLTTTGSGTATVTITDADPPLPTVQSFPVVSAIVEGSGARAEIRYTLSAAQTSPVTITYRTIDSAAIAGSDFVGVTEATVIIPAGELVAIASVDLIDDSIAELQERFRIIGRAFLEGTELAVNGTGSVDIVDDDAAVSMSVAPTSQTEGAGASLAVTFTLDKAQDLPVTITYSTANGTATAGSDFVGATSATVTIPTGQTSATVNVDLIDNSTFEPTETFNVVLNGASRGGSALTLTGPTTIPVTITDDEPAPPTISISAAPTTVSEADVAGVTVTFTLSAAATSPVTVNYSTQNGTATAGSDFTGATNQTVTIGAGQTSASITIPMIDNTVFEPSETFNVVLNSATQDGSSLTATGPTTIPVTITDDEVAPPTVTISATPATIAEGPGATVAITFTLNAAQATDMIVSYSTGNGTAGGSSDFVAITSATIVIPAGQTSATANVALIDDPIPESAETFTVFLEGADLGGVNIPVSSSTTITITDSDPPLPTISISVAPTAQAEADGASFVVTVTLSAPLSAPVDVRYSAISGTAIDLDDFVGGLDYIQIPAGQTSATSSFVMLINDDVFEPTETLSIKLESASVLGRPLTATGPTTIPLTITDDDVAPTVSISAAPTTISEASATGVTVTFALSVAATSPVTVNYSTQNGTATAGTDFTGATNQTVTIATGQTTATVTIPMVNNAVFEPNETFNVVLNSATQNGSPLTATGSTTVPITITDDDAAPSVTMSAAPTTVGEAAGPVVLTFTLNAVQASPVTVTYSTANGTATAGSDFTGATNVQVVIPAGQISVTANLPIIDNAVNEATETFQVTLNGATLNGSPITATGSTTIIITDNDPLPAGNLLVNGSFESTTVAAGQYAAFTSITGWTAITGGTIELWNAHNGVTASNGTRFAELDYAGARDGFYQDVQTVAGQTYTLSFDQRLRPSQPASTSGVEVVWNGTVIATSTPSTQTFAAFNVNVTGTGALDRLTIREVSSQGGDGLGPLIDNFQLIAQGPPVPSVTISAAPTAISEASATGVTVTFTLSAVQAAPVTVTYSTANGTATAGSDFTGATGVQVIIPAGQTSVTANIPLIDNTVFEPTETFNVVLNGATLNGSPITASGSTTISITDNEPAPPSVSISAAPTTLAEAAGAGVTVTFTLSAAQAAPTTVTYSTANGTATAGTDFTGATNATVTIPTGQTTATVTIPLINDSVFEPTETFSVVLNSAVSNGSPLSATGSATITITDNDAPPPNLLVNGSFESTTVAAGQYAAFTSITGWTAITGGTIELWNAHNGVTASNGTRFAELDYAGARDGFYQDVQTVAGQSYTLSFDQRLRPSQPASTSGVEVMWNGTVIATSTPTTQTFAAVNFTVTGTGALDRLTIREVASQGGDGLGPLIDNFALVATGAPAGLMSLADDTSAMLVDPPQDFTLPQQTDSFWL